MADASIPEPLDLLIIGAGVTGIGAACQFQQRCPGKTYAILERRESVGGTWDLFRYPGIRSDSDMMTFGYGFRPWAEPQILAAGGAIQSYVRETAESHGVTPQIRFGRKVVSANFCSDTALWTVRVEHNGASETYTARFLFACTGYYNYDQGFRPRFKGEDSFQGRIVHPQHWPKDLDYAGKRVVVIGSGATAITLVPTMADGGAAHVTMLQRTPGYLFSIPAFDRVSEVMKKVMPERWVYRITRARNIQFQQFMYGLARKRPKAMRRLLLSLVKRQLEGHSDMRHFTPSYAPWDQRLCIVPNGDIFRVIREGKASVATDTIDTFTKEGVRLSSGEEIKADLIVTATGLDLQMLGGMTVSVDGKPYEPGKHLMYKATMLEGLPNAAMCFGYINASWTLKADIAAEYVCRLIAHMHAQGLDMAVPVADESERTNDTMLGKLNSGYIQRAAHLLPRQGKSEVWQVAHDYAFDRKLLQQMPIDDGVLQLRKVATAPARPVSKAA